MMMMMMKICVRVWVIVGWTLYIYIYIFCRRLFTNTSLCVCVYVFSHIIILFHKRSSLSWEHVCNFLASLREKWERKKRRHFPTVYEEKSVQTLSKRFRARARIRAPHHHTSNDNKWQRQQQKCAMHCDSFHARCECVVWCVYVCVACVFFFWRAQLSSLSYKRCVCVCVFWGMHCGMSINTKIAVWVSEFFLLLLQHHVCVCASRESILLGHTPPHQHPPFFKKEKQ